LAKFPCHGWRPKVDRLQDFKRPRCLDNKDLRSNHRALVAGLGFSFLCYPRGRGLPTEVSFLPCQFVEWALRGWL
jgi:hypothetical protein